MSRDSDLYQWLGRIQGGMRWFWVVLGLLGANQLLAAPLNVPHSGWARWQIAAVADAPDWCCPLDSSKPRALQQCDLDSGHTGYSNDRDAAPVERMQIYAHFKDGQLTGIRAYGPSCPVVAKSEIADLGDVDSTSSVDWLQTQIAPHSRVSGEVLAALAMHAGEQVDQMLNRVAEADPARELRKEALFWLGQMRGERGAALVEPFLSADPDPQIREHAAFAISQSRSPRRGDLLIRQAQNDASTQVRSQAWFWLAQTGEARSESAIRAALVAETSTKVRHQAVFALSQLPEPRAVQALIGLLESRGMELEVRKQALFWLGQSGDEAALRYLDRMLATK